jgi:hypothetical protein
MCAGQDPNIDPWAVARGEKKRRIEKNMTQRVQNVERTLGRNKKTKKIDSYGMMCGYY